LEINPIRLEGWSSYLSKLHNSRLSCDINAELQKTTLNRLQDNIQEIKNKKARGLNSINHEMLKVGIDIIVLHLCKLYNQIFESGYIIPLQQG
jgi:hypothetical protein